MKITFVGTFDYDDLNVIRVASAVVQIKVYDKEEIDAITKSKTVYLTETISYKVLFDDTRRPIKVIFRKIKEKE